MRLRQQRAVFAPHQSLRLKWWEKQSTLLMAMADLSKNEEPQPAPSSGQDLKGSLSSAPVASNDTVSPSPFSAFSPKIEEKRWDHHSEPLTQHLWEKERLY